MSRLLVLKARPLVQEASASAATGKVLVANLESRVAGKKGSGGQGSRLKKLTQMLDEEDRLLKNVAKRLEDLEESEGIAS